MAEIIRESLVSEACVHFYDIHEMALFGELAPLVEIILKKRRKEIKDIYITCKSKERKIYDLSVLWFTSYGFDILSAAGHKSTTCRIDDVTSLEKLVSSVGGNLHLVAEKVTTNPNMSEEFLITFCHFMGIPKEERMRHLDTIQVRDSRILEYNKEFMESLESSFDFYLQENSTCCFEPNNRRNAKILIDGSTADKAKMLNLRLKDAYSIEGTNSPESDKKGQYWRLQVIEEENDEGKLILITHNGKFIIHSIRTGQHLLVPQIDLPFSFKSSKMQLDDILNRVGSSDRIHIASTADGFTEFSVFSQGASSMIDQSIPYEYGCKDDYKRRRVSRAYLEVMFSTQDLRKLISPFSDSLELHVHIDRMKPIVITQEYEIHRMEAWLAPVVEKR